MCEIKTAFITDPSKDAKKNLWEFGEINKKDYKKYIKNLASTINKNFSKIGILPDYGVPLDLAMEIGKLKNKKTEILGYYPKYGNLPRLIENFHWCDHTVEIDGGWSTMNTQPSKNFDCMICLGLSGGVFTEIAHTKVHRIWSGKKIPIFIDKRTISKTLTKELEKDITVFYFTSEKDLEKKILTLKKETKC